MSVLVIGAGIIGLSTALRIRQILPHVRVSIVADRFGPSTTSHGAAGIFRPNATYIKGVDPVTLEKWAQCSFDHFTAILMSQDSNEAGISMLSGYQFYNQQRDDAQALYRKVSYNSIRASDEDLKRMGNRWRFGDFLTTLITECREYLPWLTKKFLETGGEIKFGHIASLEELAGKHDVIVNCTGLDANKLVKDESILPIRGVMIRVKAPWIKHFTFTDENCWVVPGAQNVVIGGTRHYNNDNTEATEADVKEVFERACKAVPSLRNSVMDHVWVGLRPHREPIRIEKEIIKCGDIQQKVVHNYGHGGSGVTLSWGTAVQAADYVAEMLGTPPSKY